MRIDHYVHFPEDPRLSRIEEMLRRVLANQQQQAERDRIMSQQLDRLTTEVSETASVIDSAVTLIQGLAQQIRDLRDDPVALDALADSLDAKTGELAAAVQANSEPPPAPEEPPTEPEEPAPV